jgi:hypothetical protein
MAKEDFSKLSDDIVEYIKKIERDFNLPMDITFHYLSNKKQKCLIKFTKIPDQYACESSMNADILVIVNEEYFDNFDDDNKKILVEKEYDKIDFNFEKGIIKLSNPKISVNSGFVAKHTWKKVDDALKLEELFEQQKKEKKE